MASGFLELQVHHDIGSTCDWQTPLGQSFSPFGETRQKKGAGNADRSQIGFLMDSLLTRKLQQSLKEVMGPSKPDNKSYYPDSYNLSGIKAHMPIPENVALV